MQSTRMPTNDSYYELTLPEGNKMIIHQMPRHLRFWAAPRANNFRPFTIITQYLEGTLSLAAAIDQIAIPIEKEHDERGDESYDWGLLQDLWQTFNNIVEQLDPYADLSMSKLAQLLAALRSRGGNRMTEYMGPIWTALPFYEPTTHTPFESPSEFIETMTSGHLAPWYNPLDEWGGEEGVVQQYVSQNAFLARLVHLPGAPVDCDVYGLMALSWALETDLSPAGLTLDVPGAAMWIFYAGERLLKSDQEWKEPFMTREAMGMANGSFMWPKEKKNGFCKERWDLWRNSFAWVADMEGVSPETRDIAIKAADEMVRLELKLEAVTLDEAHQSDIV